MDGRLLKTEEAAEMLFCRPKHVGELRAKGEIEGIRIGRRWMYSFQGIIKYINEHHDLYEKNKEKSRQLSQPADMLEYSSKKEEINVPPEMRKLLGKAYELYVAKKIFQEKAITQKEFMSIKRRIDQQYQ